MANRIVLGDDGTMDTVLHCTECGQEFRYNFDASDCPDSALDDQYNDFISWAIQDAESDHECDKEAN